MRTSSLPRYRHQWYVNQDPVLLADELGRTIQARCSEYYSTTGRNYQDIIMIGHSMGAVLMRKAFVFARGQNHELRRASLIPATLPWASNVSRMILFAGMNRGWSFHPRPKNMPRWKNWPARMLVRAMTLLNLGTLLRSLSRGAPFISNLRIQWINLVRQDQPIPLVIQLLGNEDDVVHAEDNIDLQTGRDFVYKQAPAGTNHSNVVDLKDPDRRRLFLEALLRPSEHLDSDYIVPDGQKADTSIDSVIFVMHGIRDFGDWTRRFSEAVQAYARNLGRKVLPVRPGYGYFPMLKFLLFSERQINVRWFMDQYTEVLAKYPRAEIDFVGHSNGTYLLASGLSRYKACSFNRAVFAGSVVPRDYPWDQMVHDGRIRSIRNYVASADIIVGVFPRLFEQFGGDVGSSGLLGFTREPAVQSEWHYVAGGHGAAINGRNFGSIADYLISGNASSPPDDICVDDYNQLALLIAKLYWVVWLILLGILINAAWLLSFASAPPLSLHAWLHLALFILFVFAILCTI